jgi:alpha-D-ribose 1-methylphosphonate 5-triphosphate synthase subunit PhnG
MPSSPADEADRSARRQLWMGALARAKLSDVRAIVAALDALPDYRLVKRPEVGTVMIEGRAGGSGQRFNVGEATVTRAVAQLANGTTGFAYALGSDRAKAELSAVLDAVLQDPVGGPALFETAIQPLLDRQADDRAEASRKAAATKVDFFTLVRGHA